MELWHEQSGLRGIQWRFYRYTQDQLCKNEYSWYVRHYIGGIILLYHESIPFWAEGGPLFFLHKSFVGFRHAPCIK